MKQLKGGVTCQTLPHPTNETKQPSPCTPHDCFCVQAYNTFVLMDTQINAISASLDEEVERKFCLLKSIGEECISDDELRNLLIKKPAFTAYDGFEPSGRMHIAQVCACLKAVFQIVY